MRTESLFLGIDVANRIFTCAQDHPERELLGMVRDAHAATQRFEPAVDDRGDGLQAGADDIPVIHSAATEHYPEDLLLTVITDTRGVMQLHARRKSDRTMRRVDIRTDAQ